MIINQETQYELASQITTQFGALAELLHDDAQAYRLCAQINMKCSEYFEKSRILAQMPKELPTL